MESSTEHDELEKTERKEAATSALIRHLAAHAQYDAALLFTRGQYILYYRRGEEVICKGLAAEHLRAAFVEEPVDSGWLSEGVVRYGNGPAGTFFVQFIPPGKREILLSTDNPAEPLIITPPLPALIFAGVNTTYSVWAHESHRFDPSAPLFHAPFPNVFSDGHICFGSNRPPQISPQALEEAWHLFIRSPFNQDMAGGKSQEHGQDIRRQLLTLAQTGAAAYPVEDLVPYIKRPLWNSKQELRTLNDVVETYLLRKGTEQWL